MSMEVFMSSSKSTLSPRLYVPPLWSNDLFTPVPPLSLTLA